MASFTKRVAVTYGTFVAANYLSNFLLFPDKKLDYGFANRLVGREVNSEWWGTRTAHILTIALPLSVFDHLSLKAWNSSLLSKFGYPTGTLLSFARTPIPWMIHGVSFCYAGIMTYVAWDAMMNPNYTSDKRTDAFTSKAYPELQGCHTMYVLPTVAAITETLTGRPCPHGTLLGLIPPTLTFVTVKGFGSKWPWNANLTPFEKKLNSSPSPPSTPNVTV